MFDTYLSDLSTVCYSLHCSPIPFPLLSLTTFPTIHLSPPTHNFSPPRGDIQQGMNIKDALKEVLSNALCHDGVARGLREAVKALDKYEMLKVFSGLSKHVVEWLFDSIFVATVCLVNSTCSCTFACTHAHAHTHTHTCTHTHMHVHTHTHTHIQASSSSLSFGEELQ